MNKKPARQTKPRKKTSAVIQKSLDTLNASAAKIIEAPASSPEPVIEVRAATTRGSNPLVVMADDAPYQPSMELKTSTTVEELEAYLRCSEEVRFDRLETYFNKIAQELSEGVKTPQPASAALREALSYDSGWEAFNAAGLEIKTVELLGAVVEEIILADPAQHQVTRAREWIDTDGERRNYVRKTASVSDNERRAKLDRQDRVDLIKAGFKPDLFDRVIEIDPTKIAEEAQKLVDELVAQRLEVDPVQRDIGVTLARQTVEAINQQLAAGVDEAKRIILITVSNQHTLFKVLVDHFSDPESLTQALVFELQKPHVDLDQVKTAVEFLTPTQAAVAVVDHAVVYSPVVLTYSLEAEGYLSTVLFINKNNTAYTFTSVQESLNVNTEALTVEQTVERLKAQQVGSLSVTMQDPQAAFYKALEATGLECGNRGVGDIGVYNCYVDSSFEAVAELLEKFSDQLSLITWISMEDVLNTADEVKLDELLEAPKTRPAQITGTIETKVGYTVTPPPKTKNSDEMAQLINDRCDHATLAEIRRQLDNTKNLTSAAGNDYTLCLLQINVHTNKATTFVIKGQFTDAVAHIVLGELSRQLHQNVIEAPVELQLEFPRIDTFEQDLVANWDLTQEVLYIDTSRCNQSVVTSLACFEGRVVDAVALRASVVQGNRTYSGFSLVNLLSAIEANKTQGVTVLALDQDYVLGEALNSAGIEYQGHQTGGCIRYVFEVNQPLPEVVTECLFKMQADALIATCSLSKPNPELPSFDWGFEAPTEEAEVSIARTVFFKEAVGRSEAEGLIANAAGILVNDYADKILNKSVECQVYDFNHCWLFSARIRITLDLQSRPVLDYVEDIPNLLTHMLINKSVSLVEGKIMAGTFVTLSLVPQAPWESAPVPTLEPLHFGNMSWNPGAERDGFWARVKQRFIAWFN